MIKWHAKWITDPAFAAYAPLPVLHKEYAPAPAADHPGHLRNRHMLVRKTFSLAAPAARATLRITADDSYKLYVNGRFVGQGPAQGYPFHYPYNEWDVSDDLGHGDNVIAVHVYYQGHVNRSYNSGDMRQGMIAELHADGERVLATDRTWKYKIDESSRGETVGYDTQFLENIDMRLAVPSAWRSVGFSDEAWAHVAEKTDADYTLIPQSTPPVSVYRLSPERVDLLDGNRHLLDFGQEVTGQFEMTAQGQPGQQIVVRCGEELLDGGKFVRFDMRCNCRYEETWTLSGQEDRFEPFDYKAFRYVEVIGPLEALRPDSFSVVARHYPLDEDACVFETSDPLLGRIWSICRRGVQLCAQENYMDCPSREKGQYLGDNSVIGHTHLYISGDSRLFRKSIEDFALSSAVCPGLLAVAPGNFMQEIADFSLQWPMQLLLYYRHSGDEAFLRAMHPTAEGVLSHFRQYARADGLLENVKDKWNLVDWPDNLRDGYDFPLTRPVGDGCHNVINAFYYGCIQAVQEIRDLLGVRYEDELPALKQSFRDAFYRPDAGRFADAETSSHVSLHANVLPLLFGIAPDEAVPSIVSLIREKRLACGVYMSYFLLKALTACGETELLYELIMCEDEHSWANMVKEGATACFEAWGKDQKWNTSLCHGWASAPIPLLIEEIVGLKPTAPGWKEYRFSPRIPKGMPDFRLAFRTARGVFRVQCRNGQVQLKAP